MPTKRANPTIHGRQCEDLLAYAVQKNLAITLTHRTPDGWRSYASRIEAAREEQRCLVVAAPVPRGEYDTKMPPLGETVGVAFRKGHKKCMFQSELATERLCEGQTIFLLAMPDEIQQLQRRAYQRSTPPDGLAIAVRFWRVAPPDGTTGAAGRVHYGQLQDLSAGGMRVLVGDASGVGDNVTYRCIFTPKPSTEPLVLEALVRHKEAASGGRTSLGLHFIGLEATEDGFDKLRRLSQIVSTFNRSHHKEQKKVSG